MSLNALVETICYTSKSYKMLEAYHFLFLYSYCLYWKCYFIRYKLLQFNVEPLFTLKNDKKWIFVFSQTHEFTYANLIWQTQNSISLNTNVLKTMHLGFFDSSVMYLYQTMAIFTWYFQTIYQDKSCDTPDTYWKRSCVHCSWRLTKTYCMSVWSLAYYH